MKKLLLIAIAGLFMTSVGMAQVPVEGAYEVEMFVLDSITGEYEGSVGTTGPNQNARCFASNEAFGNCNKYKWVIDVTVHASVAQWIDFTMTGTRWDWFVKKPGWYAANCISAEVASNGDVKIDYDGFGDLEPLGDGKLPIPIWYSFGPSITEASAGWVRSFDLNNNDNLLDESEYWYTVDDRFRNKLHEGILWKLWNRINVVNCNTACEYHDDATITLTLESQKGWIEPEEGGYVVEWFPWWGI